MWVKASWEALIRRPVNQRIRWGIEWGIGVALVYVALIAGVVVLGGSDVVARKYGVTPMTLVLLHIMMGMIGGAVLGILSPCVGSEESAAIVGFVVGGISFGAAVPLLVPRSDWLLGCVIAVVGGGAAIGYAAWAEWRQHHPDEWPSIRPPN